MTCPRCQQENPGHACFCLGCGNRLPDACTRCGTELPGGAPFSSQCGHEIGAQPTVEPRFASPGVGLRLPKQVERAERLAAGLGISLPPAAAR